MMTRDHLKMARKKMFFSSAKAVAELGYQPRPVRIAVEDAVAWFRLNGMLSGMTLLAALSLLIWIYLLFGHGRFWQSGPVLPLRRPDATPAVAVVVPARDEAPVIAGSLRSLLAQDYAGPLRVILVDDGSTDGTGAIALAVGGSVAGVRYDAAPPPGERQGA